jgi:hypothetical protein
VYPPAPFTYPIVGEVPASIREGSVLASTAGVQVHRKDAFQRTLDHFDRVITEVQSGRPAPALSMADMWRVETKEELDDPKARAQRLAYFDKVLERYGSQLQPAVRDEPLSTQRIFSEPAKEKRLFATNLPEIVVTSSHRTPEPEPVLEEKARPQSPRSSRSTRTPATNIDNEYQRTMAMPFSKTYERQLERNAAIKAPSVPKDLSKSVSFHEAPTHIAIDSQDDVSEAEQSDTESRDLFDSAAAALRRSDTTIPVRAPPKRDERILTNTSASLPKDCVADNPAPFKASVSTAASIDVLAMPRPQSANQSTSDRDTTQRQRDAQFSQLQREKQKIDGEVLALRDQTLASQDDRVQQIQRIKREVAENHRQLKIEKARQELEDARRELEREQQQKDATMQEIQALKKIEEEQIRSVVEMALTDIQSQSLSNRAVALSARPSSTHGTRVVQPPPDSANSRDFRESTRKTATTASSLSAPLHRDPARRDLSLQQRKAAEAAIKRAEEELKRRSQQPVQSIQAEVNPMPVEPKAAPAPAPVPDTDDEDIWNSARQVHKHWLTVQQEAQQKLASAASPKQVPLATPPQSQHMSIPALPDITTKEKVSSAPNTEILAAPASSARLQGAAMSLLGEAREVQSVSMVNKSLAQDNSFHVLADREPPRVQDVPTKRRLEAETKSADSVPTESVDQLKSGGYMHINPVAADEDRDHRIVEEVFEALSASSASDDDLNEHQPAQPAADPAQVIKPQPILSILSRSASCSSSSSSVSLVESTPVEPVVGPPVQLQSIAPGSAQDGPHTSSQPQDYNIRVCMSCGADCSIFRLNCDQCGSSVRESLKTPLGARPSSSQKRRNIGIRAEVLTRPPSNVRFEPKESKISNRELQQSLQAKSQSALRSMHESQMSVTSAETKFKGPIAVTSQASLQRQSQTAVRSSALTLQATVPMPRAPSSSAYGEEDTAVNTRDRATHSHSSASTNGVPHAHHQAMRAVDTEESRQKRPSSSSLPANSSARQDHIASVQGGDHTGVGSAVAQHHDRDQFSSSGHGAGSQLAMSHSLASMELEEINFQHAARLLGQVQFQSEPEADTSNTRNSVTKPEPRWASSKPRVHENEAKRRIPEAASMQRTKHLDSDTEVAQVPRGPEQSQAQRGHSAVRAAEVTKEQPHTGAQRRGMEAPNYGSKPAVSGIALSGHHLQPNVAIGSQLLLSSASRGEKPTMPSSSAPKPMMSSKPPLSSGKDMFKVPERSVSKPLKGYCFDNDDALVH